MDENIIDQIDEEVVPKGDAAIIAGLAIVGAATILGAAGFGLYKLSKKVMDKVVDWSTKKIDKVDRG